MAYGKLLPELWSKTDSRYGFVNEVAVRTGAGIMLTIRFATLITIYHTYNEELLLRVAGFFWIDFLLKIINPRYSIIGMIARLLTRNKKPIRVGAIQKRFAWMIGFVMMTSIVAELIYHLVILHSTQFGIPWMRYVCQIFLFFVRCEAILGRCAGCDIFKFLVKHKIITNRDAQNCVDGNCEI